jgi:hypothetical protein
MKKCKDCVNWKKGCYVGDLYIGSPENIPIMACIGINRNIYRPKWYIRLLFWRKK